jgi:hypothetical protein
VIETPEVSVVQNTQEEVVDEELPVKIVTMNWNDYKKETEDFSSNYFGGITKQHRQFLIA